MVLSSPGIAILFEHSDWFQPLFAGLDRRGIPYDRFLCRNPLKKPPLLPQSYLACLAQNIKNIADNETRIQNSHLAQACFSSAASFCLDAAFSRTARCILSFCLLMAHLQLIAEPMAVPSTTPPAMATA